MHKYSDVNLFSCISFSNKRYSQPILENPFGVQLLHKPFKQKVFTTGNANDESGNGLHNPFKQKAFTTYIRITCCKSYLKSSS